MHKYFDYYHNEKYAILLNVLQGDQLNMALFSGTFDLSSVRHCTRVK